MKKIIIPDSESERRSQLRIPTKIPIQVWLPYQAEPISAVNQDISWGGALFVIKNPLPEHVKRVRLALPWRRNEFISADAEVLRMEPLKKGGYLIAVRFYSLSPRSHSRLERLLRMLHGQVLIDSRKSSDTIVRELDVTVNDAAEMRKMLAEIATGRQIVTVFDAYQQNESISLVITGTRDLPAIRLRARVIDVKKSKPKSGFDWTELYTLTLSFEHPQKTMEIFVTQLLGHVTKTLADSEMCASEAPEWLRSSTFSTSFNSELLLPTGRSRGVRCTLEVEFPEVLQSVIASWGNITAFSQCLYELVLGSRAPRGGWPRETWEELNLLQKIHDRVYGIPTANKSVLHLDK